METTKRDGLTPDWMVHAGCRVFGLDEPSEKSPIVSGLLDPCTNSKSRPNIPAEKLYGKDDDGLSLQNPWKGHHVILNPPYESQTTWRFVNRAIDEVESGNVKGVLLILRNSTGTEYFQRLMPYPRLELKQDALRFKDYGRTPIRFNIVLFCLVRIDEANQTYERFYREFEGLGLVTIAVDMMFLQSDSFYNLQCRLHARAALEHRDTWVQCDRCKKWREVSADLLHEVQERDEWYCEFKYPEGCTTSLTSKEKGAFRYTTTARESSMKRANRQARSAFPKRGKGRPKTSCKSTNDESDVEQSGERLYTVTSSKSSPPSTRTRPRASKSIANAFMQECIRQWKQPHGKDSYQSY